MADRINISNTLTGDNLIYGARWAAVFSLEDPIDGNYMLFLEKNTGDLYTSDVRERKPFAHLVRESEFWIEVDFPEPEKVKSESQIRKESPVYSGVFKYFPDALMAVAQQSWHGNQKHNPNQPLHWAKEKSNDHYDCLLRHILTPEQVDPDTGLIHAVAVAWRALAQLQLYLEKAKNENL
jgi:hypothetical protein